MHTASEWSTILTEAGFTQITISKLPARRGIPDPLMMEAVREE
jgi:hypothetical protein